MSKQGSKTEQQPKVVGLSGASYELRRPQPGTVVGASGVRYDALTLEASA